MYFNTGTSSGGVQKWDKVSQGHGMICKYYTGDHDEHAYFFTANSVSGQKTHYPAALCESKYSGSRGLTESECRTFLGNSMQVTSISSRPSGCIYYTFSFFLIGLEGAAIIIKLSLLSYMPIFEM